MDVALERFVGDVDEFFRDCWGTAPLLRPQEAARDFDDLASLDDLDHMVASMGLSSSRLRMVKDGKPLPVATYTTSSGRRGGEAWVDPRSVYALYSEGATIVLESLHRYWPPLTDLCRALELSLGHRAQVNAYLTPPGARGFDLHRDDHDVIVVQISGAKHWKVHDRNDEEIALVDVDLEPGAVLYIPKGFPHAAATQRASSAHLTIGILTHDAIDVLREVVKLAEDEPSFQERLPNLAGAEPVALREVVSRRVEEIAGWLGKIDIDVLTAKVARRLTSSAQPIVRGQLRQLELLPSVDETTPLVHRRGATCILLPRATTLKVLLADRELEMPSSTERAMEEIRMRDGLTARDLHPFLDPASALVLVRRLIKEGLLEVDV